MKEKLKVKEFIKVLEDMCSRDFRKITPPSEVRAFDCHKEMTNLTIEFEKFTLRYMKEMFGLLKKIPNGATKEQTKRISELIKTKEKQLSEG